METNRILSFEIAQKISHVDLESVAGGGGPYGSGGCQWDANTGRVICSLDPETSPK